MPTSTRDIITPATSPLLAVLLQGIQRKPQTLNEAVSLLAYIMEKDIEPVVAELKKWLVSELNADDKALALRKIETRCGCFG